MGKPPKDDDLEPRVAVLETQMSEMEATIATLTNQVNSLTARVGELEQEA